MNAAIASAGLDHLRKIFSDPASYIEALLWIREKKGNVIPFKLNDVQIKVMQAKAHAIRRGKKPRFLILKARRMGITTFEQAMNFWLVATHPNRQALTIAHNAESTEKIFRISNMFFDRLAEGFRPRRLTSHNKRDLNFPFLNSQYYVGTAGSRGIGRGDTLNRVHWSEVAWTKGSAEDQANILAGLTEACSEGEVVLETTANGVGDLFHTLWTEATSGEGEWTPIFLPWWADSTYRLPITEAETCEILRSMDDEEKDLVRQHCLTPSQIAWRRAKIREIKRAFPQEYPENPATCFLVSGSRFFDPSLVEAMTHRVGTPIETRDGGQIRIFKKAVKGRRYCAGADVAAGIPGGDYSVLGIIDAETEEHVAVMRGHWSPEDFAVRSEKLCREYNTALLAVERNNHGHSMLNTLKNVLHYPNLYRHLDWDQRAGKGTPEIGFPTDSKTRPIMLDDLREAIEKGHMQVHDLIFLAECLTFVADANGKYQAREGCFDDCVLAWAIALQARKRMGDRAAVSGNVPAASTPARVFPTTSRRFF